MLRNMNEYLNFWLTPGFAEQYICCSFWWAQVTEEKFADFIQYTQQLSLLASLLFVRVSL